MTRFVPNPIVIKENGKPFKIIELSRDFEKDEFSTISIYSNGELIKFIKMDSSIIISLDRELGLLNLVYRDKHNKYVDEQIIDTKESCEEKTLYSDEELLYQRVKNAIMAEMEYPEGTKIEVSKHTELLKKATVDKNARVYVTSKIRKVITGMNVVPEGKIEEYTYKLFSHLYGLGVIQELDDNNEVGEIMVNAVTYPAFKAEIYYYKNHIKYLYDKTFNNLEELRNVFQRSIEFSKKEMNSVDNAIIEAIRPNKDRVNIEIPEASENWVLNIRKFGNFTPNKESMKEKGTIDDYLDGLFEVLVQGKANIGVGGPMNVGKTTLINFLLTYTKPIEQKVIISSISETDVAKILKGHHVVTLNVNEEKGFTFEKQIRSALRTTADRIIVHESRGKEFVQVHEANVKIKGNMFSGHATDDEAFMDVCVDMYLSGSSSKNESSEYIKNKLAKGINIVVMMTLAGNKIRVQSVSEVLLDEDRNYKKMNKLYQWVHDPENPSEGRYVRTNNRLSDELKKRLNKNGVPMSRMKDL